MIDLKTEAILSLKDSCDCFPGRGRLHISTVQRWRQVGVRGVRLETVRVGGKTFTTREAISRFISAQNQDADRPLTISMTQRQRQSDAAREALRAAGI